MKDQRKTEIKVGLMVLVGLIIFLWILGWAKNFSIRDTDRNLLVRFNTVSGLEIGDYVTVNGVRKGVVEDYAVDKNDVIVKISIDKNVVLQRDAVFAVTMLDLMGGKKIDIIPGTAAEEINYNEVQQGVFFADIPAVMTMLGSVQEDLFTAIKEVNVTLTSINKYLNDEKMDKELRTAVTNMSEITAKLNLMIDENRKGIKELTENTVVITRDAKELLNANREDIEASIKGMQSVMAKTDSLMTKLNNLSDETVAGKNNLGKLLYDDNLMSNLTETLSTAKELVKLLTDQLKAEGIKVDASIDLF
jgi:phospholipid/cholesterol/gamma-HCH transport system substrate-binding protein